MPNIYGCHFEYANSSGTLVSSRTYGLIFASVDTGRLMQTEGQISGATLFSKPAKKRYLIDDDYSESPLTFDVEIITDNESTLSYEDRRNIEKWLFNRHEYRKLYIDSLDDCDGEMTETKTFSRVVTIRMSTDPAGTFTPINTSSNTDVTMTKRLYLNCRFVNPERIETTAGCVGFKATLEADSNMWWQDAITLTYNLTRTDAEKHNARWFTIPMDTDSDIYCYPIVHMSLGPNAHDAPVGIVNLTDEVTMGGGYRKNRPTRFENAPNNGEVTIDGNIGYITESFYDKAITYYMPRLFSGDNSMAVYGDVLSISFTFQNRRAYL